MQKTLPVRIVTIVGALLLVVSMTSCKKAADLTKSKEAVLGLAKQYGPQLKELGGKLEGLMGRANEIPDSVPGAEKIKGLLTSNKDKIVSLVGMLDNLPGKVTEAAKSGKQENLNELSTDFSTSLSKGVGEITTDLNTAETDLVSIEAEAKKIAAGGVDGKPGVDFAVKLDDGIEITGLATGLEYGLMGFINDGTRAVDDKTEWFNFDRLVFEEGKSTLDTEKSKEQLANIAAIMKAYPTVKLKIGGYTDNTGSEEANKKLSQERADTVMKALVDAGVSPDRLAAEGYGPQFPVCEANDTDECKAKNRRISIRVSAR